MELQSPTIGELAKALAKVQAKLRPVAPNRSNTFFKSRYADLEACVEQARPILPEEGLAISQLTGRDESGPVLVTVLLHESGEWLRGMYPLNTDKPDPQTLSKAVSYARRVAYCAILGLTVGEEDDDGNAASQPAADRRQQAAPPKRTQANGKATTPAPSREVLAAKLARLAELFDACTSWDELKAVWAANVDDVRALFDAGEEGGFKAKLVAIRDEKKKRFAPQSAAA